MPSRHSRGQSSDHVSADRIFISYRRADSGGWARSLHDKLEEQLGPGHLFRDVAMQGGVDFHQHVESLLDRCEVLLAVIGKHWTSITDADGHRRLDNPDDLVRREIARALERPDVQVIPVLVDGAQMPTKHELPPDLAPLSRHQACELTDSRWDYDVETLTRRLHEILGEKPPRNARQAWPLRAGLLMAALLAFVLVLWPSLKPEGTPPPESARTPSPTPGKTTDPTKAGITVDRWNSRVHANRLVVAARGTARNLSKDEVVYAVLDPDPPGAAASGDQSLGWFTSKATVPDASAIWEANISAPADAAAGFTVFAVLAPEPCSNCSGGPAFSPDELGLFGPSTPGIIVRSAAVHGSAGG